MIDKLIRAWHQPQSRGLKVFFDRYYWITALLIAQNGIQRSYRNSYLGICWMLLQPLTQVVVLATLMPHIMRFPIDQYVIYLVISLPLWSFISSTLIGASTSIISQAETLKRCMIPTTVFPLADVLRNAHTYLISFATMYACCLIFFTRFDTVLLLLPLYFLPVLVILSALSVAIAFLTPYIRDLGDCLHALMSICFWLTPAVYSPSALPERIRPLFNFNPFYIMMRPIQQISHAHKIPDSMATLSLLALTALTVALSYVLYRLCRKNFVYYL